MIQYALDALDARNDPPNASSMFQECGPIEFQLLSEFYINTLSTEITLGSLYDPIPDCM